jgi:hypothetical protein
MSQAPPHRRTGSLLAAGTSGLVVAALGMIACSTPILAFIVGVAGLGAAGTVGKAIDVIALPMAVISGGLIVTGIYRRRRADTGSTSAAAPASSPPPPSSPAERQPGQRTGEH